MNADKVTEYANKGCALFYFTLILMVCGSALGYGASAGMFPELKAFIDSGNAQRLAEISGNILGVLIGLGLAFSISGAVLKLFK